MAALPDNVQMQQVRGSEEQRHPQDKASRSVPQSRGPACVCQIDAKRPPGQQQAAQIGSEERGGPLLGGPLLVSVWIMTADPQAA